MEKLKINGKEKQFDDGQLPKNLAQLLDHLNIKAAAVVAEINGNIISRNKFEQTQLTDGQEIELIKFAPGG